MDREYEGANRDLRWSMLGPSTWETEAGGWLDWSTLNYVIRTFQNQNLTKQYLVFGHLMCSPEAGFSHMWKNLRLKREAYFALICLCSLKWRLKPSTYPLSACYMNRSCWFKKKMRILRKRHTSPLMVRLQTGITTLEINLAVPQKIGNSST